MDLWSNRTRAILHKLIPSIRNFKIITTPFICLLKPTQPVLLKYTPCFLGNVVSDGAHTVDDSEHIYVRCQIIISSNNGHSV